MAQSHMMCTLDNDILDFAYIISPVTVLYTLRATWF